MPRFSRVMYAAALYISIAVLGTAERPRLAVLTDIGADPDDQQSMIRLMMYANEFDLELLIATGAGTPGEMKEAITRPELIRQIVDAYGDVLPNLQRHAAGWPTAESLRERVTSGNPHRGRQYVGEGHDTAASRALIAGIDAGTSDRPLNIAIWGGQTDFAQALWRVKQDRGTAGLAAFVRKLRVYDIGDQDRIAD
jgi:Cellulose-binding Sde182, nucleoside hydrolase-like domain